MVSCWVFGGSAFSGGIDTAQFYLEYKGYGRPTSSEIFYSIAAVETLLYASTIVMFVTMAYRAASDTDGTRSDRPDTRNGLTTLGLSETTKPTNNTEL